MIDVLRKIAAANKDVLKSPSFTSAESQAKGFAKKSRCDGRAAAGNLPELLAGVKTGVVGLLLVKSTRVGGYRWTMKTSLSSDTNITGYGNQ